VVIKPKRLNTIYDILCQFVSIETSMLKHYKFIILLFISLTTQAQQIVRSTIGSVGSSMSDGTILIQQTVGQPALTSFEKNEDSYSLCTLW